MLCHHATAAYKSAAENHLLAVNWGFYYVTVPPIIHTLAATFITVAIPYVVTILFPELLLPDRYKETPAGATTVTLAVPRFMTLIAVPMGQDTELLSAKVRVKFDADVE